MSFQNIFKTKSAINSHWEFMLNLLTEKNPSELTKSKIAKKLGKSSTTIGNISKELYKLKLIDIDYDDSIIGTSKQRLKLSTPHLLYQLVMEITNNRKVAKNYSDSYKGLKDRFPQKENINYEHYFNSWKDLFNDVVLQDFIKKTPSIMISFILFFDLLLSVAEIDESMAKDDVLGKFALPVRKDFLTVAKLPRDILKLFFGIVKYNIIKLVEEVTNLSFTNMLKIWLSRNFNLTISSSFIHAMSIIDLNPDTSQDIIEEFFYQYYMLYITQKKSEEFPTNLQPLELFFNLFHKPNLTNFVKLIESLNNLFHLNSGKKYIKISKKELPSEDLIDTNKSPVITIYLKNGSEKQIPISLDE